MRQEEVCINRQCSYQLLQPTINTKWNDKLKRKIKEGIKDDLQNHFGVTGCDRHQRQSISCGFSDDNYFNSGGRRLWELHFDATLTDLVTVSEVMTNRGSDRGMKDVEYTESLKNRKISEFMDLNASVDIGISIMRRMAEQLGKKEMFRQTSQTKSGCMVVEDDKKKGILTQLLSLNKRIRHEMANFALSEMRVGTLIIPATSISNDFKEILLCGLVMGKAYILRGHSYRAL